MKHQTIHPFSFTVKQDGAEAHEEDVSLSALFPSPEEPLRILIAPSGFKESLGPEEVADCVEEGLRRLVDHSAAMIRKVPLHDGGEGFCRAVVAVHGGETIPVQVTGPVGEPVQSHYGIIRKSGVVTGVLDMAAAAGLRLVPTDARDPTKTTTYGVGELMAAALDQGCSRIIVGYGDSGTSDGGAGLLQALGVKLLDADDNELPKAQGGRSLVDVSSISLKTLHPRLREGNVHIEAVCNVINVLCGERGVARIYGPQKGATPEQVEGLSLGMERYAEVVSSILGSNISTEPGSGASGGLGAGLLLLGGQLRPRSEAINDHFAFDSLFEQEWDVVITAEGMIDSQSTQGKMTTEIARRGKKNGALVIALAGTIGSGADSCLESGIEAFASILQAPTSLADAIQDSPRLLREGAERVMRMIMVGMQLRSPSPRGMRQRPRSPSGRMSWADEQMVGDELQKRLVPIAVPPWVQSPRPLSPARVGTF
ncbi:uncharacterized protein LTR77_011110 [Saxophila tyrrhenica]|uniref:Glycerate kinase n=1 Tax=Saxophila tyrrhenica TaxID=1690608 RepID=A0AAV9NW15_9PEZI|nr:hypothetical protein LTR77_011110 [Saxophila tyrrhenica]